MLFRSWLGMSVARRGECLTFMTDKDGFDLALMDDAEPSPMPPWFHFGYRLQSPDAVLELHRPPPIPSMQVGMRLSVTPVDPF